MEKKSFLWLSVVILAMAMLACNLPTETTTTPEPPPTPTSGTPGEPTATPTSSVETPTPEPTDGPCTFDAQFEEDVTIPDNTSLEPGTSFTKVWRVRNSGTCAWEEGTQLAFVEGERLDGPDAVDVGSVEVDVTVDVGVELTAPDEPGTYRGDWRMESPDGTAFGDTVYVQIVVPEPSPTPRPTEEAECVPVDSTLEPVLELMEDEGYDIGCPIEESYTVDGALQEFWRNIDDVNPNTHFRSLMIWYSDTEEIHIVVGEDTDASEGNIRAYTDFWEEGDPHIPPDCQDMTVPEGYELPARGFGKIWCDNELWDVIGWPDTGEQAATLLVQPTETGQLLKVATNDIAYLIAMDYRAVYALTQMTTP